MEMSSREFLLEPIALAQVFFKNIYDKNLKQILWVDWGPDNDLWSPGARIYNCYNSLICK